MEANELIEQINERQKGLTKKNQKYFDDILIYVRLSFDKSEQETEEVLAEILDHIILAQEEGRNAVDVFGTNPKAYLHELIGELPKMVTKKRSGLFLMGILYFFASAAIAHPIINGAFYYIFNIGELSQTFHIGSSIVQLIISIPIAFVLIYTVTYMLRWLCFRNIHKIWEFLMSWVYGVISIGLFLAIFLLIPVFGQAVEIPSYMIFIIGIMLLIAARITRKRV